MIFKFCPQVQNLLEHCKANQNSLETRQRPQAQVSNLWESEQKIQFGINQIPVDFLCTSCMTLGDLLIFPSLSFLTWLVKST